MENPRREDLMIDEKNFKNILKLIENSSLKIQGIKDAVSKRQGASDVEDVEFVSLVEDIDKVIDSKKYDDLDAFFANLNENISSRLGFLTNYYKSLDETFIRIQNVAKHIDEKSLADVEDLAKIVEAFLFKIKILQGVVQDIDEKIESFTGDNISVFLKSLKVECNEFDEEFNQVFEELKNNFSRASELSEKLISVESNVEIQEELFAINVGVNALMSAVAVFDEKYKDIGKTFEESKTYRDLKDKINQLATDTKSLNKNLKTFGSALEGKSVLSEQLDMIAEKVDAIQEGLPSEYSEDFDFIKNQISILDKRIAGLDESMQSFEDSKVAAEVEDAKKHVLSLEKKIDVIGSSLKEGYGDDLNAIKETIKSFDEKLDAFEVSLKGVQGVDLVDVQKKIDGLGKSFDEVRTIKEDVATFGEKVDGVELSIKNAQSEEIESVKDYILNLDEKIEVINALMANLNSDDFAFMRESLASLGASDITNTKKLTDLEDILVEINSSRQPSQEKIDYLHQIILGIDFEKIEQELGHVNADLALIINEVKKNRTYSEKHFDNLQDTVSKINLNELKLKLNEIDSDMKEGFIGVARAEDMQGFVEGMDYILQKFEMLSNFVESCDEFFLIKEQFVGVEQSIIEIKKSLEKVESTSELKKFISANQEKTRVLIEALNNTEKIVDLKHQSDAILSEAVQTREIVAHLEKAIDAIGFDEFQDAIMDLQNVTNGIKDALIVIDEKVETLAQKEDVTALRNVIFDSTKELAQKSDVGSLSNDLKDVAKKSDVSNLEEAVKEAVDPLAHKADISVVSELINEKNEQLEYLIRVLDNSEEISEIKQAILQTTKGEDLEKLGQRLDELLQNQKEARGLLANLNTKDIELAINALTNEQKESKELLSNLNTKNLESSVDSLMSEQKEARLALEQLIEVDYVDEVKNVFNLVDEKFDIVESLKHDISSLGVELESTLRQEDIRDTVKHVDDIQFAVKETLSESALIREDVGSLETKIEELKTLLDYVNHKKDFQDVKGILTQIKDKQDDTKEIFSSLANVDDVAQLGSLINDNYHEIRLAFEELEPSKQAGELNKILEGFKKDQQTMSAVIADFEKKIDEKTLGLVKDQIEATENELKEYIERLQAKEEVLAIKAQIDSLTQDIVMQIMQVFENISFDQETQEIKEFVEESEINIKGVISGLKASVERLLDAPQPVYITELKDEVEKLAQGIIVLSDNVENIGPEVSEYITTIDSIRVSLEELANTQHTVKILEQEIGGLNVDIGEVLKVLKDVSSQCETIYTLDAAKSDFDKVSMSLESIIKNQYEQKEAAQKEDIKGGIDNVNLSISNINDRLTHFVSDYKNFADKVVDTVENLDNVTSHISNIDSVNSEYKKGVNESFRLLKTDLEGIVSKVNYISDDVDKVSEVSNQILDFASQNKQEITKDLVGIREVLEQSDIMKVQDGLSNVIFSLTGFIDDFEKKYADLQVDSKSILSMTEQGKEICENLKGSMVYMAEWVNSSGKTFSNLQESINSFRSSFDEKIQDLKSIDDVKVILSNLETTLGQHLDFTLAKQLQEKFEIDLIPSIQANIDSSLEEKLTAKLAINEVQREEDRQGLKAMVAKQLSEENQAVKEAMGILEQKLVTKIQAGVEKLSHQEISLDDVNEKIESEIAIVSTQIASTQQGLAEIEQNLSNEIIKEVASIDSQVQATSQDLQRQLQSQLQTEMVKVVDSIDTKMEAISSKLQSQDERMQMLDGKLKEQDMKMELLIHKIDDFMGKVSKVQTLDLGEQVIALEGRMGSLDENIQKIVSFVEED